MIGDFKASGKKADVAMQTEAAALGWLIINQHNHLGIGLDALIGHF